MAVSKLRNRVVLFRLTQDEYDRVQQACADASARSISDFARARILGDPANGPSLSQIETKLAELSHSVEKLARSLAQEASGTNASRPETPANGHALVATTGD